MSTGKTIYKQFVSDIDQALNNFNANNPRSAAQQAEIDKYQQIHQKRDQKVIVQSKKDIWDFE